MLLDSETGTPSSTFTAGPTWSRDGVAGWGQVAHTNPAAWGSSNPSTAGASTLVATSGTALPAGQPSFLFFQHWRLLETEAAFRDAGTVEVDDTGDLAGPVDTASQPWTNGPVQTINSFSNPANGRLGFAGDSRGYLASRLDLSSFAGSTVKPQFTMNTNTGGSYLGWWVDDIVVYTCDPMVENTAVPSVAGTPRVGSTLSAATGTWTPGDVTLTYQWFRGNTSIPGATSSTYKLQAADVGATVKVRVTGARANVASVAAFSSPTGLVAPGRLTAGKPAITGTAKVGKQLTAKPGTWQPPGIAFSYQWLRNGATIAGAKASTYTLTTGDRGKRISVRVTGKKAGYATSSATSAQTAKVKP